MIKDFKFFSFIETDSKFKVPLKLVSKVFSGNLYDFLTIDCAAR